MKKNIPEGQKEIDNGKSLEIRLNNAQSPKKKQIKDKDMTELMKKLLKQIRASKN